MCVGCMREAQWPAEQEGLPAAFLDEEYGLDPPSSEDEVLSPSSSSSSDSGESATSASEELRKLEVSQSMRRRPAGTEDQILVVHKVLRTVHRLRVEEGVLACGRELTHTYRRAREGETDPKCRTCFGVEGELPDPAGTLVGPSA